METKKDRKSFLLEMLEMFIMIISPIFGILVMEVQKLEEILLIYLEIMATIL